MIEQPPKDTNAGAPIGLYFARLWYYEELYPLVFALRGLSGVRALLAEPGVEADQPIRAFGRAREL